MRVFFFLSFFLGLSAAAQDPLGALGKTVAQTENFRKDWKPMPQHGTWRVLGDREVQQTSTSHGNTGFYRALEQLGTMEYECSVKLTNAKTGCGIYIFATDAEKEERGEAYLLWLGGQPKINFSVSKIINNQFPKELAKFPVDAATGKPNQIRIRYDTDKGEFTLWCNGKEAGKYTDPDPYRKGSFVSLSTSSTQATFQNLRISQLK